MRIADLQSREAHFDWAPTFHRAFARDQKDGPQAQKQGDGVSASFHHGPGQIQPKSGFPLTSAAQIAAISDTAIFPLLA